jgi:hypothetical protein
MNAALKRAAHTVGSVARTAIAFGSLALKTIIDPDTLIVGGLIVLAVGLYAAWPPLAGIVPGAAMFGLGIWSAAK